eukprot:439190-Alexandrium_andersonii.AAC.1
MVGVRLLVSVGVVGRGGSTPDALAVPGRRRPSVLQIAQQSPDTCTEGQCWVRHLCLFNLLRWKLGIVGSGCEEQ